MVTARESSYGLGTMLAGVTLEVTIIKRQSKRWLSAAMFVYRGKQYVLDALITQTDSLCHFSSLRC